MAGTEKGETPAWMKCTISSSEGNLEALGLFLTDLGSGGYLEEGATISTWFEPARKEEIDAYLTTFAAQRGEPVTWEWEEVPEEDWWESWKKFFHPFAASERIFVRPSWEKADPPHGGMVTLITDPGRAFGTGAHETTRMCLNLIDEALAQKPAARMFDVGSGSGILTIAARLLGVGEVTAIDIDTQAVSATLENTRLNNVADGVLVARADVRAVNERYELVVCNILYQIIMGIAPELVKKVAPGGLLILAGFLTPETQGVEEMFERLGMKVEKKLEMGQWASLVLRG